MLQLVTSMRELDIQQLLCVHSESITDGCCDRSESIQRLQAEQDFYDYLKSFFHEYRGMYALWVIDGRYRSALRLEPYRDGLLLSGLETAQNARGSGYATSLVCAVLEHLRETGCNKLYAHVDKSNFRSLQLHNTCGFQRILEHAVYVDGSVYHNSCTFCYTF